jgi:hypothetical protein
MAWKRGVKQKSGKLGAKSDPLATDVLLEQARKIAGKASPQPEKEPTIGCASIEFRKGRPYYYRRYYVTVNGKRVRKKEYLGKELPKGMRIRGR